MFDRFFDKQHNEWSKEVKERDRYNCQICRRIEHLNSHHLNSYDIYIDQRYDLRNGITLCSMHHDLFHDIYGRGNNSKGQFREFLVILRLVEKISQKNTENNQEDKNDNKSHESSTKF